MTVGMLAASGIMLLMVLLYIRHKMRTKGLRFLAIDQVAELIAQKEVSVFDTNPPERWERSRLPGAKWVAFDDVKAADLPENHARKLVFYCASRL